MVQEEESAGGPGSLLHTSQSVQTIQHVRLTTLVGTHISGHNVNRICPLLVVKAAIVVQFGYTVYICTSRSVSAVKWPTLTRALLLLLFSLHVNERKQMQSFRTKKHTVL